MTKEQIIKVLVRHLVDYKIPLDLGLPARIAEDILKLEQTADGIKMPFDSPEFLVKWIEWKTYRKKEKRLNYKSPLTEQAALNRLFELSKGDESAAIEIIKQSIANQYQGLFATNQNQLAKSETGNKPLWR